jgi:hypothetical protein
MSMTFSFGQTQHERIEIEVFRYERSPVGEYYDDNWLIVQVRVWVGGFRGKVDCTFITEELVAFLTQLRLLYQSLLGTAKFTTLEEQLYLRLTGDGKGHIELSGEIADQPDIGNRLHFTLHFDQTQLGVSIHELERVTSTFTVRAA